MSDSFEKDLDAQIKAALTGQDREILEATQELGWFQLGLKQFRGKLGWVTWVLMVVQTLMFVAAIWCAIKFFGATDVMPALKWGFSASVLMLGALQIKLSLMPQIQADRVIREVKRLQLMIAAKGE
ncbi:DUF6768 family protein [uncultured Pelagimonas sp.]|uniref:DUF6768 family protein n=1 Tax=uncultured Pelagimonas sp. TaxID=1618102 RepID=UPI00260C7F54|nr:DUF6768 family protein [uncultured Pelagimonas sp.]